MATFEFQKFVIKKLIFGARKEIEKCVKNIKMRLKFIINDRNKIKAFVCSIQMLSRHTDRLIFVVKDSKCKFLSKKHY